MARCHARTRTLRDVIRFGNNARLVPYDPDSIDLFFIVDGDLSLYLIPSRVIAGRVGLLLRTYSEYIVGNPPGSWRRSRMPRKRHPGYRLAGGLVLTVRYGS